MSSDEDNQVRYVCLSDLHLGNEYSILNNLSEKGEIQATEVMINLKNCLRSLLPDKASEKGKNPRPTLILNGDVMDLTLGKFEISSMMFEKFMGLIMKYGNEIFDNDIIYVPGNHDHHVWEAARENQYENYIATNRLEILPPPWHRTKMTIGKSPVCSKLFWSLLRQHTVKSDTPSNIETGADPSDDEDLLFSSETKVQIYYPSLVIPSDDPKKCAIVHHGHFTELPYYLVSTLNTQFNDGKFPQDINVMEQENSAWIDFLWCTLGQSGDPSRAVGCIYYNLKNPNIFERILDKISNNIIDKYKIIPFISELKGYCIPAPIGLLGERYQRDDHADKGYLNDSKARKGLTQFLQLSWPFMKDEIPNSPESINDLNLIFVYGHTHKPIAEKDVNIGDEKNGITINKTNWVYNTGGWVVDQEKEDKCFGASIVLMNRNLDTVFLQVYAEGGFDEVKPITLNRDTEFYKYVAEKVNQSYECWEKLKNSADTEHDKKVDLLRNQLEHIKSKKDPIS